jgi:ABC-2 type transport system ATP-binding protein/lipopolysaccharide transport system ATP-binding protein
MTENAIELDGVSKRYRLGATVGTSTLREALTGVFHASLGRRSDVEEIWSLRDVSFDVPLGERIGIIGRNGAGKSTLLKILSRITEPTSGVARMRGRVGALLEVGTGFHPELTGRENVYLNGVILGMSRADIERRFDDIVEFSGVARFLDTPVKRYSSGMYLRLAFAVAAHLEPDVMVVDEVLAVGDAEFQRRCLGKMEQAGGEGRTVVFVSHDMDAIARLCRRCVWLDAGVVRSIGPTERVIEAYLAAAAEAGPSLEFPQGGLGTGAARLLGLRVLDGRGIPSLALRRDEAFTIELEWELHEPVATFDAAVLVTNLRGVRLLDQSWSDVRAEGRGSPGRRIGRITVPPILNVGPITIGVWLGSTYEPYLNEPSLLTVDLEGSDMERPDRVICIDVPWEVEEP